MIEDVLARVPVFALVFFRLAGMTASAPLFGSPRIPKRVKLLLVLVLAFGVSGGVKPVELPASMWELAVAIGGELAFGAAMGMVLSFVFVAAQWAGEMIGIQMGLNMSEVFDPQFGSHGSLIGEMYYMLTLIVFLAVGGLRDMLLGTKASFDALPLLSIAIDQTLFELIVNLLTSATVLALRLAAPMLVTALVVDLALGLIGRTMPQFNVMQAGMSIRSLLGIVIIVLGLTLTGDVIGESIRGSLDEVMLQWSSPRPSMVGG